MHGGAEQSSGGASANAVTRRRAIDVARSLALEGGIGAVRMRDVSRRSGIPEHDLYRCFSSSEHLLVLAQQEWIREAMEAEPLPHGPGVDGGDRVAELVHRSIVATAEAPRFVAAVLAAFNSVDPAVRDALQVSNREVGEMLRSAAGPELVAAQEYVELLGVSWMGVLSAWALGNLDLERADVVAQRTARLLYRSMLAEQLELTRTAESG